MNTKFVSEPIKPDINTMRTHVLASGEPSMPAKFLWRDKEYKVNAVLARWHETGKCKHGSNEQYVRRHWFIVRTKCGLEMQIYFERQAQSARDRMNRWWLYSISEPDSHLKQERADLMHNNDLKLIILDLDDTLINTRLAYNEAKQHINGMFSYMGIDSRIFWQRYESMVDGLYIKAMSGKLPWHEYRRLRFMMPLQELTDDYENLADFFGSVFTNEMNKKIAPFEDTISVLKMLGEIGIKRMLLTNGPSLGQRTKIKNCGLEKYLDGIFISEELKCAKPDPEAFNYIMELEHIERNQAVMIGDSIQNDIAGAENAGIIAILMDRFNEHLEYNGCRINQLEEIIGILQLPAEETYFV